MQAAYATLPRLTLPHVQPFRFARSVALTALAAHTVVLPLPLAAPASTALAAGGDEDPLPSTYRIDPVVSQSLYFNGATPDAVIIEPNGLATVHVGKSYAVVREEEAARQAEAAEAARQKELAAQQERDRQLALQRQKEAEAKKAAAQKAAVAQAQQAAAAAVPAGSVEEIARLITAEAFGESQWPAMRALINRESHFNVFATNARTGAYGIPQALPGSKMASAGADWRTNPATQMRWMVGYVRARYGTPERALAHSYSTGWY